MNLSFTVHGQNKAAAAAAFCSQLPQQQREEIWDLSHIRTLILNTDSFSQKMTKSKFIKTVRTEDRNAAEVKISTFQKSSNHLNKINSS